MSIAASLLPEFDQEMTTTRRLLERVPSDRGQWNCPFETVGAAGHAERKGFLLVSTNGVSTNEVFYKNERGVLQDRGVLQKRGVYEYGVFYKYGVSTKDGIRGIPRSSGPRTKEIPTEGAV